MHANYIEYYTRLLEANVEGHFAIASGRHNLAIFLIQKYVFDIGKTDTKNGWYAIDYCSNNLFSDKYSIPTENDDLLCVMISKANVDQLLIQNNKEIELTGYIENSKSIQQLFSCGMKKDNGNVYLSTTDKQGRNIRILL